MTERRNVKSQEAAQYLDAQLAQVKTKLESWAAFVEAVDVPSDIYPALQTGRPELLKLANPRALTQEECAKLYQLLAVLIETNQALQQHSQEVGRLVNRWADAFKHLHSVGLRVTRYANFESQHGNEEEREE